MTYPRLIVVGSCLVAAIAFTTSATAQTQLAAPVQLTQQQQTLLRQLNGYGSELVARLAAVYHETDDAKAASLLDQLTTDFAPLAQQLQTQSGALSSAQHEQVAEQMRQQPWIRQLSGLTKNGADAAFEQRLTHSPALRAAYSRFVAANVLGRQPHSGPVGSAPVPKQ